MSRTVLSRLLALLGVGGITVACNTGGEVIDNPVPDTESEPNDTLDQATALGGPGELFASGQCNAPADVDHYSLLATSGGAVSATIDYVEAPISEVALLSSDGSLLASSASPLSVAATAGTGGHVVLRVTCGSGTGGYSGPFESE